MIKQKIKNSIFYKIFRFIETSAIIGLLLTIGIFWYQTRISERDQERLIGNLQQLEQSLSTRYLGIFPNYLTKINELLSAVNPAKPIIIFEDVLYYGIFSSPAEFKIMVNYLLYLSDACNITIVYYDTESTIFRRMIQEGRIKPQYLKKLGKERREWVREYRKNSSDNNVNLYAKADSALSEKYFAYTRKETGFRSKIEGYLKPLYDSKDDKNDLFNRIDKIKQKALDKDPETITFYDFYSMYKSVSQELSKTFSEHNIELIAINEYLTMSCWLNNNKAVFAFPSKYNSNEIGFYTQDHVFTEYINAILDGIKSQSDTKITENGLP